MSFPWIPYDPTRLMHSGGNYTTGLQEDELSLLSGLLSGGEVE